jgi:hypothetical protein
MLATVAAFHLFVVGVGADGLMGRVNQAREALPEIIAGDKPQVMVFGSSMVGAAFEPRIFDAEVKAKGKEVSSYNFGFGGLNPFYQDYLSRRIREDYQAQNKRLKLAVIEFNPFQTTQTRWNRAQATIDSYLTMLASDEELIEIALADPGRGLLLFNIKYLRANVSAEMITTFFGREIFPAKRATRLKDDEKIAERRRELRKAINEYDDKDFPDYHGKRWYLPWGGGGSTMADRSPEVYELVKEQVALQHTEARMTNYVNRRVQTADILELNMEPILVEGFIGIVENFKQFSDKVEVVMLPRNTDWVNYSPEARARLDKAINQIEQATGIKIVDHQVIDEVPPEMFWDATHLSRYIGDVAYTKYLAEQYFNDL